MDSPALFRRLLQTPTSYRSFLAPQTRPQARTFALLTPPQLSPHPRYMSLPRIIQPSFWASMVPKPLKPSSSPDPTPRKSREWNPATPYIILSLLVGSQAIQILWLKQERAHEMRRAEAKIGMLREVVERVQRGEDVDVERVLGSGDEENEKEWAEVLEEIEDEELLFQSKKKRRAIRQAAAEEEKGKEQKERQEKGVKSEEQQSAVPEDGKVTVQSFGEAKFY